MKKLRALVFLTSVTLALLVALLTGVIFVYRGGDSYAPFSWQRKVIWFSKRAVAEVAAAAVTVWDPYASVRVSAPTGPELSAQPERAGLCDGESFQAWLSGSPRFKGARVEFFVNGRLPDSQFRFDYQPTCEPRLDSLRALYRLDTLISSGQSDYEVLCAVTDWLHAYFKPVDQLTNPMQAVDFNFNALDVMHRAGKGEKFWCSEYSTSLVQCLAALGFTGRYLMINSETGGHVTVEAWCGSLGKWVMLDPYFGRRVTLDGEPLNVYEVHALPLNAGSLARAQVEQAGAGVLEGAAREFYLSLYRTFAVRMRNDWFTNRYPHWYPLSNSVMNAVEWQDDLTVDNVYYKYETGRLADLYWPLDEVKICLVPQESGRIRVSLSTFTPDFSHFEVRIDSTAVRNSDSPEFDWNIHSGWNGLSLNSVNNSGRHGRSTVILLEIVKEEPVAF